MRSDSNYKMIRNICLGIIVYHTIISTVAVSQIKIDVKTSPKHKEKARLAKAGLVAYLKQSDWAKVVNVGERYAVWIENYNYKIKENTILFDLDLELRTRADILAGKLLQKIHIVDTVDLSEVAELKTFEARELSRIVAKQLTKSGKLKGLTSALGVFPGASAIVERGLKYFGIDLNAEYSADEAIIGMVLGSTLIAELKPMIDKAQENEGESEKETSEPDN